MSVTRKYLEELSNFKGKLTIIEETDMSVKAQVIVNNYDMLESPSIFAFCDVNGFPLAELILKVKTDQNENGEQYFTVLQPCLSPVRAHLSFSYECTTHYATQADYKFYQPSDLAVTEMPQFEGLYFANNGRDYTIPNPLINLDLPGKSLVVNNLSLWTYGFHDGMMANFRISMEGNTDYRVGYGNIVLLVAYDKLLPSYDY